METYMLQVVFETSSYASIPIRKRSMFSVCRLGKSQSVKPILILIAPPNYNPLGDLQPFNDLTPGPTGMYFSQTTANLISHFNYQTEEITNFAVPTLLAAPLGMNFFRGYLWYAELLGNKIARFDPITNQTKEYPLPISLLGPAVVRATFSNPDRVCFTAFLGGANGCIGVDSGKIDVYPNTGLTPALSLPAENTKDLRYNDIICKSSPHSFKTNRCVSFMNG